MTAGAGAERRRAKSGIMKHRLTGQSCRFGNRQCFLPQLVRPRALLSWIVGNEPQNLGVDQLDILQLGEMPEVVMLHDSAGWMIA